MGVCSYCKLNTLDLKVLRDREWTVPWGRLAVPITDGAWQEAVLAIVRAAGDALVRPVMSSPCAVHQLGVRARYQAIPDLVEHGEAGLFPSLL